MQRYEVLSNPRMAGAVKRYHAWPTHTTQTVADHTWNVLRIWWQLFGPLPPRVSTYILWHDCGELVVGDPPYPSKANDATFKAICDRKEEEAVKAMGGPEMELPWEEAQKVKLCDLIEMLEFGLFEKQLGNEFSAPIIDDILKHIWVITGRLCITNDVRLFLNRQLKLELP